MTLNQFLRLIDTWKHQYHTTGADIVFQNQVLKTNVFFTNNSMHAMQRHTQDAEKLPATIVNPVEVWSKWADPDTQQQVLRAYIGDNYVVLTLDGVVIDGLKVTPSAMDKYRKGVPLV